MTAENDAASSVVSSGRNVAGTTVQMQGNAISSAGGAIGKGASKLGGKIKGLGH